MLVKTTILLTVRHFLYSLYFLFSEILQIYHDTKTISAAKMPQIIGLTASIGVGKTKNNAVLHAAKMCANLDASHIVRVREHLEELYQHVPTIPDSKLKYMDGILI
jgi:hypothetical protein